jgi:hypothetical protein
MWFPDPYPKTTTTKKDGNLAPIFIQNTRQIGPMSCSMEKDSQSKAAEPLAMRCRRDADENAKSTFAANLF